MRSRWLVLFIGLAVGLRAVLGIMHPFQFPDSADYDALARSMLEHGIYQVGGNFATRMPGYPLLLAGVYAVFGYSVSAVMILQAAIGGMIVWMTYLIGRRCSESVGLIAAGLAAIDPLSIAFSASVLSETPFTLALLVALWIAIRLMEQSRLWRWIVLGAVWGLAVYLRASAIWCLVPIGVCIACGRSWAGRPCHGLLGALCAILMVFLLLVPWQVRNARLFGSDGYFRLTTLEGISLHEAVYEDADGGPKQDVIRVPKDLQQMDEARRNDAWTRMARAEIVHHPARILWLAIRKIGRTWSPFLNAGEFQNPLLQTGLGLWHIPLFILAILGIFNRMMRTKMKWLLLTPVIYFTAVHALFLGSVRYRVPLMPIVCIFAALGIAALWRRLSKPRGELTV